MLKPNINDREKDKFVLTGDGETAVRVVGDNFSGSFTMAGLKNGGKLTKVTLNASTWTALPPTPLAQRNALSIQNTSQTQIVIDYLNTNPVYEGVILNSGAERFYSITDQIIIYGKAQSGTPTIMIEEIS